MNKINIWIQELQMLESEKQIIDNNKRKLGKKIANLRNKIAVYKIRGK